MIRGDQTTLNGFLKRMLWKLMPGMYWSLAKPVSGQQFSIGIFQGDSVKELVDAEGVANPVMTSKDVTDLPAVFVADPFMIQRDGTWYMFFEVFDHTNSMGRIGVATSSDGKRWEYQQIVLNEPFHVAYPLVFVYDNEIFMVPDSPGNGIRLYRATNFPTRWSLEKEISTENVFSDSTVFEHDGRWWMFTAWAEQRQENKTLRLFHADNPTAEWVEHPASPVVSNDNRITRPGGRVQLLNGKLVRFTQDCTRVYGECVRCVEITRLTTTEYEEKVIAEPILKPGNRAWRRDGMHHIDAHQIDMRQIEMHPGGRVARDTRRQAGKPELRIFACVDGWQMT